MSETDIRAVLASLTLKQREVLDLLLAHKTSKEIARDLGISPHTVDQRIQFAKAKLGVDSRGEVAVAYRHLLQRIADLDGEASDPLAYEETRIAAPAPPADTGLANGAADNASPTPPSGAEGGDYRVAPEMFEGRHGTVMRLVAIALLAILLLITALGSVAMFAQLSRNFAGS